jgi:hypothetical protein
MRVILPCRHFNGRGFTSTGKDAGPLVWASPRGLAGGTRERPCCASRNALDSGIMSNIQGSLC